MKDDSMDRASINEHREGITITGFSTGVPVDFFSIIGAGWHMSSQGDDALGSMNHPKFRSCSLLPKREAPGYGTWHIALSSVMSSPTRQTRWTHAKPTRVLRTVSAILYGLGILSTPYTTGGKDKARSRGERWSLSSPYINVARRDIPDARSARLCIVQRNVPTPPCPF